MRRDCKIVRSYDSNRDFDNHEHKSTCHKTKGSNNQLGKQIYKPNVFFIIPLKTKFNSLFFCYTYFSLLNSVQFGLFNPLRFYSVHLGSIQSILILFGSHWFYLAHSVLFDLLWLYSIHIGSIQSIRCYSVQFASIWSSSVHSVHFGLFGPYSSYSIHIGSIQSYSVQFGPIRCIRS